MADYSYGPKIQARAKHLLSAILTHVETGGDEKNISFRWREEGKANLTLKAKRRYFEELTRRIPGESLSAEHVREALSHHFPKYLKILDDHRTTTKGSEEWDFTLKLWTRDRETNLRRFDELWEEKRPEKSKSLAASQIHFAEASKEVKPRCFISYGDRDPDQLLAKTFQIKLEAEGYNTFMAGENIRLGEDWVQRIGQELQTCDYMLLLLSEQAALSEMVTEKVKSAKQRQEQTGKPFILPIRVKFPLDSPLNYELRGYLQRIKQREWKGVEDTPKILEEVLELLQTGALQETQPIEEQSLGLLPVEGSLTEQESVQTPPLHAAEPELPRGQVYLASPFYVKRVGHHLQQTIEAQCYDEILQPGALIRIKAPRQMGKTSLTSRILRHGEEHGCIGVLLSFQSADSRFFQDLDGFLRWFAVSIGRKLRQPSRLNEIWDNELFGSKASCTAYFEDYLLPELTQPLVLCLDDADRVFSHPDVAQDFFDLLRNWHEMGKTDELWKKLRLVVVHSTEAYISMLDINRSPFNVGLSIELPEFTAEQVKDLAMRHGLSWGSKEVERLMGMIGGHPYLVRVALYYSAKGQTSLDVLLRDAPTEAGIYGEHLRRHLWNLQHQSRLVESVRQLLAVEQPVRLNSEDAFQLDSMGLVSLLGNDVRFRSKLYRTYFADRLSGFGET